MIDKKAKKLFLKYMENKSSLNPEEVEYIKEKSLLREDIAVTEKEFITNLEKMLTKISGERANEIKKYLENNKENLLETKGTLELIKIEGGKNSRSFD